MSKTQDASEALICGWIASLVRVRAFPPYRKVRDRVGHPFFALESEEKQILRFAQDDNVPKPTLRAVRQFSIPAGCALALRRRDGPGALLRQAPAGRDGWPSPAPGP